jgi:hypothetical protein
LNQAIREPPRERSRTKEIMGLSSHQPFPLTDFIGEKLFWGAGDAAQWLHVLGKHSNTEI